MNKQEAKKRLDAIEREAKELRMMVEGKEYSDGTPGYFTDIDESYAKGIGVIGFLKNEPNQIYPYNYCNDPELTDHAIGYRYFTPITEAILPPVIEHDGGEYPGDPNDEVRVHFRGEHARSGKACEWGEYTWRQCIIGYQIIKRAEK
jgi:hypothetical protein